jgi:hypothetical protein
VLLRRNAFETGKEDQTVTGPRIEPKVMALPKAEAMSAENPQFCDAGVPTNQDFDFGRRRSDETPDGQSEQLLLDLN